MLRPVMHIRTASALSLIFANLLLAQEQPQRPNKVISLSEAVQQAVQNNLDIQIEQLNPEVQRFTLKAIYGAYDPSIYASGEHTFSSSAGGIDAQNRDFSGSETDSDNFGAGFRGILPTGLEYNLNGFASHSYGSRPGVIEDRTSFVRSPITTSTNIFDITDIRQESSVTYLTTPTRFPFEQSSARVGAISLRQPFLKDFWIDATRLQIRVQKNRLKYSEWALRLRIEEITFQVENAYNELIFSRENVRVQEKALEQSQRLLFENRKRVEVGAMAPLDEKEAQSQVAQATSDLLRAQNDVLLRENALKNLITGDYAAVHDQYLIPAETLVAVPVTYDLQESWRKGMAMRPELVQARLDLQRNDLTLAYDKNQLLPRVDAIGEFGYTGTGREYNNAFSNIRDRSNPFYAFGGEISYPIGNVRARNNLKASKVEKEQSKIRVKKAEQDVMIQIDNAIKSAQSSFARVAASREARLFAEEALRAEEKKLENGKSTSFNVLIQQRTLTERRTTEVRALADYNNALSEIAHREGSMLERHQIKLEVVK